MSLTLTSTLAGIGWDPEIRGILAVLVGVVVLCGSVYLLLATNLANRLGFMVALTGLMGWMAILGSVWWIYGIGLVGDMPAWQVSSVNYGDLSSAATQEVRDLDTDPLPPFQELNDLEPAEYEEVRAEIEPQLEGWRLMPPTDPDFGEAMAVVDEFLTHDGPAAVIGVEQIGDYMPTYAFERGGKEELPREPDRLDRIGNWLYTTFVQVRHPTKHAVVQVHPTTEESRPAAAEPGQPPPSPEPDPDQPTISVILERDLGQERLPAALITMGSLAIFIVLCFMLHQRDQVVARHRAVRPTPAAA